MLTPIDVHYLVGLLTLSASGDDVEVELGSMVEDVTTETKRDVDITVTHSTSSGEHGYAGIEVKRHGRKLGTEHVEQLCAKLNDMPSLTSRAIVSASGYTKPSVKKAEARGVDLLELVELSRLDLSEFSVQVDAGLSFTHSEGKWIDRHFAFLPERRLTAAQNQALHAGPLLAGEKTPHELKTLKELGPAMAQRYLDQLSDEENAQLREGKTLFVNQRIEILDPPHVLAGGDQVFVDHMRLQGRYQQSTSTTKPKLFGLRRLGDSKPYVGCAVGEAGGHLLGILLRQSGGAPLALIPISDRLKKKIYRQKLNRC